MLFMQRLIPIASAIFLACSGFVVAKSDDLPVGTVRTVKGREFAECRLVKREPDGLTFRHRAGVVKLSFPELGRAWQLQHDYDPEKAAAYAWKQRRAAKEWMAAAAEAEARLAEQRREDDKRLAQDLALLEAGRQPGPQRVATLLSPTGTVDLLPEPGAPLGPSASPGFRTGTGSVRFYTGPYGYSLGPTYYWQGSPRMGVPRSTVSLGVIGGSTVMRSAAPMPANRPGLSGCPTAFGGLTSPLLPISRYGR
jgi:hypothetical protein